jgi:hypothetical protein
VGWVNNKLQAMLNLLISSQNAQGSSNSNWNFPLPARLHLDRNVEYEAALVEIHVPTAWLTIGEPVSISLESAAAAAAGVAESVIQPAYYSTIDELVVSVNESRQNCRLQLLNQSIRNESGLQLMEEDDEEEEEDTINVRINARIHKVEIVNCSTDLKLKIINEQLSRILGFDGKVIELLANSIDARAF